MFPTLHIITAITRPHNLPRITDSITSACVNYNCNIIWHWRYDKKREHVGGQKLKNDALDIIQDGWVYLLDDDTILSAEIIRLVCEYDNDETIDGVIVQQENPDGTIRITDPNNVRWGFIDTGQALLRRSAIGNERIPEEYIGDGLFYEKLIPNLNIKYEPIVGAYYNYIKE